MRSDDFSKTRLTDFPTDAVTLTNIVLAIPFRSSASTHDIHVVCYIIS